MGMDWMGRSTDPAMSNMFSASAGLPPTGGGKAGIGGLDHWHQHLAQSAGRLCYAT